MGMEKPGPAERRAEAPRLESDSMGEVEVPGWAYWGAQTQRAIGNFGVSDRRIPPAMIRALAWIKCAAAEVNADLGLLDGSVSGAIVAAADEVLEGRWDDHFPVDVFQTGSGTSWNMNINEVLANRANERLGAPLGARSPVHPNDHVNRGQSSNDVIPTAMHIADTLAAVVLAEEMRGLREALASRAGRFRDVVKIGRTHLQDAVPMTLGQEFSGYVSQIEKGIERLEGTLPRLEELALGGTAIGTGLNAHPDFGAEVIRRIAAHTGHPFRPARNYFEAIACRDAQVELMGAVNTIACSLMKIADDLRLLSSGPRAGLGEIVLPSLQPGSSIMPGKVNPVIPEMVIQVAAHLMGRCLTVSRAAQSGPLELNIMMPLIADETIGALELAGKTCRAFAERCVRGIEADEARCALGVEWSLALVTSLAARIGYDRSAALAHRALREQKTIRQVLLEEKRLTEAEIDEILDPGTMTGEA